MIASIPLRRLGRIKFTCTSFTSLRCSPLRAFGASAPFQAKNRIFNSVRNQDEFDTMLLLSATNRTPLITLWTASWCSSCKVVAPGIRELIERDGIGENEGGVSFAEVEIDSPTIGDLAMRYMINSIPTLLSFSRQEAQVNTKVTSVDELKDTEFLRLWIQAEARRGGAGGAGGGLFGGLFGLVNR